MLRTYVHQHDSDERIGSGDSIDQTTNRVANDDADDASAVDDDCECGCDP